MPKVASVSHPAASRIRTKCGREERVHSLWGLLPGRGKVIRVVPLDETLELLKVEQLYRDCRELNILKATVFRGK